MCVHRLFTRPPGRDARNGRTEQRYFREWIVIETIADRPRSGRTIQTHRSSPQTRVYGQFPVRVGDRERGSADWVVTDASWIEATQYGTESGRNRGFERVLPSLTPPPHDSVLEVPPVKPVKPVGADRRRRRGAPGRHGRSVELNVTVATRRRTTQFLTFRSVVHRSAAFARWTTSEEYRTDVQGREPCTQRALTRGAHVREGCAGSSRVGRIATLDRWECERHRREQL